MASSGFADALRLFPKSPAIEEERIETAFIEDLHDLKYTFRPGIPGRASLGRNFREKLESPLGQQKAWMGLPA